MLVQLIRTEFQRRARASSLPCHLPSIRTNKSRLTTDNIDMPVLFIQATQDAALPPEMSKNMGKYIPKLTKKAVDTGHWALWTAAQEVNGYIAEWLAKTEGPNSNL